MKGILSILYCEIHTKNEYCEMHTVKCIQRNEYFDKHTVKCILSNVHSEMHIIKCIMQFAYFEYFDVLFLKTLYFKMLTKYEFAPLWILHIA